MSRLRAGGPAALRPLFEAFGAALAGKDPVALGGAGAAAGISRFAGREREESS